MSIFDKLMEDAKLVDMLNSEGKLIVLGLSSLTMEYKTGKDSEALSREIFKLLDGKPWLHSIMAAPVINEAVWGSWAWGTSTKASKFQNAITVLTNIASSMFPMALADGTKAALSGQVSPIMLPFVAMGLMTYVKPKKSSTSTTKKGTAAKQLKAKRAAAAGKKTTGSEALKKRRAAALKKRAAAKAKLKAKK